MKHLIAFVCSLCLLAGTAHATVFWDDEMEDASTHFNASGFLLGTLVPAGTVTFDTSVKFSGSGSIRLNYPANCLTDTTVGQCGGAASAPFTPTDDLWMRLYFRMSGLGPNTTSTGRFIPAITAYTKMMKTQNGTTYPRSWSSMGQNNTNYGIGYENVPSFGHARAIFSSFSFANDQWYCLETHQKMNTVVNGTFIPDGISQQYVDGVLVSNVSDLLLRNTATSPTAQWTEVGIFRQVGAGNIWYDKWAVGDTRIGCSGTVTPPDTTPPSPPTSPVVTASGTTNSFTWINGTDGVALSSAAVERCAGVSCIPTALTIVNASNGSVGSYLDTAVQANTVYGYRVKNLDTSSNASTYTTTVYTSTTPTTFRNTQATDGFNRADNTDLGALWTPGYGTDDPLTLQSNRIIATNVNPESTETYVSSPALSNDQWAQITLPDTTGTGGTGTLTVNHLAGAVNSADLASYPTASVTPTANACVLVAVANRISVSTNGGPNTPTLTGNGLTYVQILSRTSATTSGGSSTSRITLFRAMGAAPTAGAITIDLAGQTQTHAAWDVTEFTGADTSGTSCSGGIVQSNSTNYAISPSGAVSPATVTLGSAPASANNITYAWVRTSANNADTVGAGFTQLFQGGDTIDGARFLAEYKLNAQTASATFPNAQWIIGAVEVRAAAGGTSSSSVLLRYANAPTKTGYECRALMPSTTQGVEITAGVRATQSTSATWTWQSGDMLRGEVEGTTIRCYGIRGATETLITSFTDATLASGKAGLASASMPMDDWVVGIFQSSITGAPSVTSALVDAAGANLTFGAARPSPTNVRVTFGTNSGLFSQTIIEPFSAFPSGRYTRAWLAGLNFACFVAVDALGVQNNVNQEYQCRDLTPFVPALDQTPAILTNPFPTSILPVGTTARDIGFTINKPALCRLDLNNVAYSLMTIPMTVSNLTASANIAGLTDGVDQTYYYRCLFTNIFLEEYPNLTSGTIRLQVDTVTVDGTPPSTVPNVVANAILNASDVSLVFGLATDNVAVASYQIFHSLDNVTYQFSGTALTSPSLQLSLTPDTLHYFRMKAVDTSGNLSANFSNVATATTLHAPDVVPPSQLQFKTIIPSSTTAIIEWNIGTDNSGATTSQLEYCAGALCANFTVATPSLSALQTVINLTADTAYRLRGRHFDLSGNAGPYSDIQEFRTLTAGGAGQASIGVCNCRNQYDARH